MISVIVPVYNVEKYLSRCVDSILSQTYKDFEIILFDDGSTDSSGKICDDYAQRFNCVRVLHSPNGGPSAARNRGRAASKGDYITFVDSDDVILPDYLESLYNLIIQYNADISLCEFQFFYDDSEIKKEFPSSEDKCFPGLEAMTNMLYGRIHGSSACAILLKSEIAKKFDFQIGKYHEDDLISFRYFEASDKVVVTSKKLYCYFQREGSIMHSSFGRIALDELDAADYIETECFHYGGKILDAARAKKFFNYRDVLFTYPNLKTLSPDTYHRVSSELRKISMNIIKDSWLGRRVRLSAFIYKYFGVNICIFVHNKLGI